MDESISCKDDISRDREIVKLLCECDKANDSASEVTNMARVDLEDTGDTKSPFLPYCKGLRLFKVLGLPLKIVLTDEKEVKFEDRLRFFKCGLEIGKNCIRNPTVKSSSFFLCRNFDHKPYDVSDATALPVRTGECFHGDGEVWSHK